MEDDDTNYSRRQSDQDDSNDADSYRGHSAISRLETRVALVDQKVSTLFERIDKQDKLLFWMIGLTITALGEFALFAFTKLFH